MLGIPLPENKKGSRCLFFVFGFGLLVSKRSFMFSKDICYISPNYHFMILIEIDPISKIFVILLDGPSSFVGARLFEKLQNI